MKLAGWIWQSVPTSVEVEAKVRVSAVERLALSALAETHRARFADRHPAAPRRRRGRHIRRGPCPTARCRPLAVQGQEAGSLRQESSVGSEAGSPPQDPGRPDRQKGVARSAGSPRRHPSASRGHRSMECGNEEAHVSTLGVVLRSWRRARRPLPQAKSRLVGWTRALLQERPACSARQQARSVGQPFLNLTQRSLAAHVRR